MARATLLLAGLASVVAQAPPSWNPQPIVGVLSMPNTAYSKTHGASFFPASYVKWLEAGGVRVVPIPFDLEPEALAELLRQLNGALFTGGASSFYDGRASDERAPFFDESGALTAYGRAGSAIFNESLSAHARGEVWPLWGTCLGHEFISVLASELGSSDILTGGFDAENLTLAVSWTPAADASRLFGSVPDVRERYAGGRIAMNAHSFGITPESFAGNERLSSRFEVLATQVDRAGKAFTAAMEGKDGLPVYSTQWHSEKSLFEWPVPSYEFIAHNLSAVVANHWPTAFFASEASRNGRAFDSPEAESAALIYNYSPLYNLSQMFEQLYFFPAS